MSAATHRAAIVAQLQAVPGIGRVHSYQRYAREEAAFQALYLYEPVPGTRRLRGWQLSRVAVAERLAGLGRTLNEHTWELRGYLALHDAEASELAFDQLVEDIRAALRADPGLGGLNVAEPLGEDDGWQMRDAGPVLFCGVLCHSALLTLQTREYV